MFTLFIYSMATQSSGGRQLLTQRATYKLFMSTRILPVIYVFFLSS